MERFELDTKGICLLCFKPCDQSHSSDSPPENDPNLPDDGTKDMEKITAFKMLLRYLKVNILDLNNFTSSIMESMDTLENTDLVVSLCQQCFSVAHKFSQLYHTYEQIRLRMDKCVESVYDVMVKGKQDEGRVREYQKRMKTRKPAELVNASIVENLRNKTFDKCALKVEGATPRVILKKDNIVTKTDQNSVLISAAAPLVKRKEITRPFVGPKSVKMRLKAQTQALKCTLSSPSTSQNQSNYLMQIRPKPTIARKRRALLKSPLRKGYLSQARPIVSKPTSTESNISTSGQLNTSTTLPFMTPTSSSVNNSLSSLQSSSTKSPLLNLLLPSGSQFKSPLYSVVSPLQSTVSPFKSPFNRSNPPTQTTLPEPVRNNVSEVSSTFSRSNLFQPSVMAITNPNPQSTSSIIQPSIFQLNTTAASTAPKVTNSSSFEDFNTSVTYDYDDIDMDIKMETDSDAFFGTNGSQTLGFDLPSSSTPSTRFKESFYHVSAGLSSKPGPGVVCDICGKYIHKCNLLRHKLTVHGKTRAFSCNYCGRTFTQSSSQRRHLISVHALQELGSQLPIGTTHLQLNKAVKGVLDNCVYSMGARAPYRCPYCEHKTKGRFDMRPHVFRKHFDVVLDNLWHIQGYRK